MTNPYSDFGSEITGERFIGRQKELSAIRSRVFSPGGYGSISIVGMPRVGKTSLIAEAIRQNSVGGGTLNIVTVFIDVGAQGNTEQLFKSMIRLLYSNLLDRGIQDESLRVRCDEILLGGMPYLEQISGVLKLVRALGVRVVYILDEFDAGRNIFIDNAHCFHWLRNLCSSDPAYKVTLIVVSKRPLETISRMANCDSDYWANVMERIYLHPFCSDEFREFLERLDEFADPIPDDVRAMLLNTCGTLPGLVDSFAYEVVKRKVVEGDVVPDAVWFRSDFYPKVRKYYRDLGSLLETGSELGKLIQAVVGPQYDLTHEQVEDFIAYGVLRRNRDGKLTAFANDFVDYVEQLSVSYPVWPLWHDTERALRLTLSDRLEVLLGSSWPAAFKRKHKKQEKMLEAMEESFRRKSKSSTEHLLNYAYPKDLFELMTADWMQYGHPLLGKDKAYWSNKFTLLARVRNPLAHNNDEQIEDWEIRQVEGICREILNCLEPTGKQVN